MKLKSKKAKYKNGKKNPLKTNNKETKAPIYKILNAISAKIMAIMQINVKIRIVIIQKITNPYQI